ncbi:cache domain-containing protein [Methanoculleus horonobensis]|uniref:cache domain-containing protein n=1 Tax=Methanoculleus horonobensis TaxID=528314 RepID=UPI000834AEAA|nr:cache domain-containing protein [Methanoculleus horonobensis]MDD3069776.1 cache domain-containing protein [Methanoculleus horonobensis]MDD4251714.1 cache domain-containing protein [Methanoculleus horonobensis]
MNRFYLIGLVLFLVFAAGCTGPAGTEAPEENITHADLAGFVQEAAAYAETAGEDAALAEFNNEAGRFTEGALYVYAYDYNGTLLAHPYEKDAIGSDRGDWTDVRGLPAIRIGADTAANGGGYIAYLYPAPKNGSIDEAAGDTYIPKLVYVAPAGETWWVASGVYLSDVAGHGVEPYPEPVSAMVDLVERGAAYGREQGTQAAFAEISNASGEFVDTEGHYLYAYDYNGTLLAHPHLQDAIGTSLIERQDPYGMKNIRALCGTAESGGGFIVFIWPNPAQEDRNELKIGYVLPVDDTWWVGSGVYLSEITESGSLPSPAP